MADGVAAFVHTGIVNNFIRRTIRGSNIKKILLFEDVGKEVEKRVGGTYKSFNIQGHLRDFFIEAPDLFEGS